ncbi:MAG: A/G-specific adenine glycosylase [Acidothermus sp.]|nr:A/G-specific adenine glycosylase [Acidothermus sp.]
MLQQTPVNRVLPVYLAWIDRWPTPARLAASPAAEALRAWGRLGYPRRALRLHQAARVIQQRFGGRVPDDVAELRTLPGVGAYTAAAVAAFAYGKRVVVLDTNIRRVVTRLTGTASPSPHPTAADYATVDDLLPSDGRRAARVSLALMELGALICTSSSPRCADCPLRSACRWGGTPTRPRRRPAYRGSDRHARGVILGKLRDAEGIVPYRDLVAAWPDPVQLARAADSLIADGLISRSGGGYRLGPASDVRQISGSAGPPAGPRQPGRRSASALRGR